MKPCPFQIRTGSAEAAYTVGQQRCIQEQQDLLAEQRAFLEAVHGV